MTEIDLDRGHASRPRDTAPSTVPKRRSTSGGITFRRSACRRAIALELAQLLERVDPDVRVGADADADPALREPLDRREAVTEIRLGRRADADPRARVREQVELARPRRAFRGRSSCAARGSPRWASSSIGRTPCSARHSSISRGCSSAWTWRTSSLLPRRTGRSRSSQSSGQARTEWGATPDADAGRAQALDLLQIGGRRRLAKARDACRGAYAT